MRHKFDEIAKGLAQSVTRRQAFKRFGVGLAGMVLACFGLANKASAGKQCLPDGSLCANKAECCSHCCIRVFGYDTVCVEPRAYGGICPH
jgi:hypothetical protein